MSRKQANIHYIYKTINLLNGKYYIGKHSAIKLDDGYLGSGKYLRRAIRKYGKENFKKEILEFCGTKELCNEREKEIVTTELVNDSLCMNLMKGGKGGFVSLEACRKGAKRMNEIVWKDEEFVKRTKIRGSNRFKKMWKENNGRRLGGADKGWHHTSEAIEKMKSHKGKGTGKKNSQYGKCWIHIDETGKSIKKEDLENWLSMGWKVGRPNRIKIAISETIQNKKLVIN